jgi:GT2 family glycosyltransferase
MKHERICVVILNWNNGPDTTDCLQSLLVRGDLPTDIVICDNASSDNSVAVIVSWLEKRAIAFSEFVFDFNVAAKFIPRRRVSGSGEVPAVALIHTGGNLGYAGGNNVGIYYALEALAFDFLLVLNNDTIVNPGALSAMVSRMADDPNCGICGAKVVYFHSEDRVQAWGGAKYSPVFGRASHLGADALVGDTPDVRWVESRMDYVLGAAMMVTHGFLDDIGAMSDGYFLYFEEIDWATRARSRGYHFGYAPDAVILHKEGATIGSNRDKNKRSRLSHYYLLNSRIKYTRRYYPWFLPTVICYSLFQAVRVLVRGDWPRFLIMLRAIAGRAYSN